MSDAIVWVSQPPPRSRRTLHVKHSEFAAALRDRPGQWALFGTFQSSGVAAQIRDGALAAFRPAGTFEATSRTTDAGIDIYARCIPEDEQ